MKNLEMIFNNDDVSINYNIELIDMWKERINPDVDKLKDEATKISKDVKYLKGFEKFVIDFCSDDYYDNCNRYLVPCTICTSDSKKIKILYDECYTIPKAWTKQYVLFLKDVKDIRGFNKFINALGIEIEKKRS